MVLAAAESGFLTLANLSSSSEGTLLILSKVHVSWSRECLHTTFKIKRFEHNYQHERLESVHDY